MAAMKYEQMLAALKVFELGERASLKEIKSRHRELVKRYHPDAGATGQEEAIRQVNAAYRVLLDYVNDYRFCFGEEEFYEQNPEERLIRQFSGDPLWGSGRG
jgi:DnaJ-class molecular chaperone